jgi:hypothetical protein
MLGKIYFYRLELPAHGSLQHATTTLPSYQMGSTLAWYSTGSSLFTVTAETSCRYPITTQYEDKDCNSLSMDLW